MKFNSLDNDIIFYAFRYCLSKNTYAVSNVVEYLMKNWKRISPDIRDKITEEILNAIENKEIGMDYNVKEWNKIINLK